MRVKIFLSYFPYLPVCFHSWYFSEASFIWLFMESSALSRAPSSLALSARDIGKNIMGTQHIKLRAI